MYTLGGEYPESPAESEESVTDESPDNDGSHSSQAASPFGARAVGRDFPSRRESTAEKQRKWAVRTFTLWCNSEGVTKPVEEMQPSELNQLLKKFYKEARRKDGCDFSKPGLTNIRNALDRYFRSQLNITILKTSEFAEANKAFDEKVAVIEGNAASPWRHSVSISPQDMQKLLLSGAIGGTTPLLLLRACWFNILLHFDIGDHLKQRRLSKQQFVIHIDAAGRENVKMISTSNPYVQSKFGVAGTTMHSVPGHPLCPVALLKKYLLKLHPGSDALFQCPVQYKVDDSVPVWYEKQAVGVHALEGMMACLSKEAKLSRIYSNGCLRKSSSLVYLQCGFGFNPRELTPDTPTASMVTNNLVPSTSGMPSLSQSSLEHVPHLSSPSTPPVQNLVHSSSDQSRPNYYSTMSQPSLSQSNKFENMGSPVPESSSYPQINSTISLAKGDTCHTSKRPGQPALPHLESGFTGQSRTAIGVCMPTIKMEQGDTDVCEGVQPTFPSESLDFPSVTETITVKQEGRTSITAHVFDRQSPSVVQDMCNKTYLHMEVLGGKSFMELDHSLHSTGKEEQSKSPTLVLHLHFRGQRFKSNPTPCKSEPSLKGDFFLELHNSPSADGDVLLSITDPINLILSKTETTGSNSLIGSHSFEWQKVLKEPNGVLSVNVDINGMGEENKIMIGSLELRFQVLPHRRQIVQPQALENHLSSIHRHISERERRFMNYARQWWKSYISSHQSHSRQQVKIFAQNECGTSKPVISYITPIHVGWLLDNPRHAAQFVSLLKHEEECSMFGIKVDTWSSLHALLCRGKGSCEDHATLLCSIFLGFGLDAFVCLGTRDTGQPHAWVMTRQTDGLVSFWETLTGQCFSLSEGLSTVCSQFRTLACVFSNTCFYANIQANGLISQCDFDLNNPAKWKAMDADAIYAICGSEIQPPLPVPPSLTPSTIDVQKTSQALEEELRSLIENYRQGKGLETKWDNNLSNILSPILTAQESEAKTGQDLKREELYDPVYRYLNRSFTLQSVTTRITHLNASQAFSDMQLSAEYKSLIDYQGNLMEFALRVHVFPYPESACAVWVILGAKAPANNGEVAHEWKLVQLQRPVL
ncbi:centrosomal protein of 76 kDa-like [Actinia tenebrosa]|uniref:Centrosomal protein of 76 kDa n=1 Tax=Actinia tenebrosa TaxID=6105 RepID=A0A6P8HI90_ACTTE|nr:centrosomal protein of 76 kDa-like [Actinia tenebrosa]